MKVAILAARNYVVAFKRHEEIAVAGKACEERGFEEVEWKMRDRKNESKREGVERINKP